jgi:hypothetical protein
MKIFVQNQGMRKKLPQASIEYVEDNFLSITRSPGEKIILQKAQLKSLAAPLFLLLIALAACASDSRPLLPKLDAATTTQNTHCETVYPRGAWQFVHSIDFSMADGSGSTVIGVTNLTDTTLTCVLMTLEGLTLFAAVARQDNELHVQRAVPPFDKPAFAQGLLEDVRSIFLPPPAATMLYGFLADRIPACRYSSNNGRTTDILPTKDGCWRILTYTPEQTLERSITGHSCRKEGGCLLPEYLELKGFGHNGYTLKMTLIQAENLKENPQP